MKTICWLLLATATSTYALEPIKRTGGPLLKPALNAFSFLELLNENIKDASKGIDPFGVCDFCAKHNIEAVDLTGYFFPGYLPIETLAMGRRDYDPYAAVTGLLAELRAALANPE